MIKKISKEVKGIISVENHGIYGGLGSAVAEVLAEEKHNAVLKYVAVNDTFTESGKTSEVKEKYGLNKEKILEKALEILG